MRSSYNILILGASYGSLLATKLLFGGHRVTLVCLPDEVDLINVSGVLVRMPIKGRKEDVEIDSTTLPGSLSAAAPTEVTVAQYELCLLYTSPSPRDYAASRMPSSA